MRRKLLTYEEARKNGAKLKNGAVPSHKLRKKCLTKNELLTKFKKVKLQNSGLYLKEDDEILNTNDVNYATPVYIRFNPMGDRLDQTGVTINNFRYKLNDSVDVETLKFDKIAFGEKVPINADFFIGDEIFVNPKIGDYNIMMSLTYHPSDFPGVGNNGSENDTDYLFVSRYPDSNVINIYRQVPSIIKYTIITIRVFIDVNYNTYNSAALKTLTATATKGLTTLGELPINNTFSNWVSSINSIAFQSDVTDKAPNNSTVRISFSNPSIFLSKSQETSTGTASISKIKVGDTVVTNRLYCDVTTGGPDNATVYVDVYLKYNGTSGGTDIGGGTITTGGTGNFDPVFPIEP